LRRAPAAGLRPSREGDLGRPNPKFPPAFCQYLFFGFRGRGRSTKFAQAMSSVESIQLVRWVPIRASGSALGRPYPEAVVAAFGVAGGGGGRSLSGTVRFFWGGGEGPDREHRQSRRPADLSSWELRSRSKSNIAPEGSDMKWDHWTWPHGGADGGQSGARGT